MRLLLTSILFILCFAANAQSKQDVVYLKNGSILRGELIKTDSITVSIEILGGNVFVFENAEVLKITQENAVKLNTKGPFTPQKDGWYTEFSFGIPFGIDQWGWPTGGITLNTVVGYQYKSILKSGIGTGIDWYAWDATMIPLFARVSGDLTKKINTPFYRMDVGYSANITNSWNNDEKHYGGILLNIGGGLKFNTRKNVYYCLSLGYKTQFAKSHYFQTWLEEPYWEYRQFNRIEGRLAIGF
ncbi:MAG: hypothetical protein ACPGLV_10400 [Bacteroidia bacterium]